MRSVFGAAKRAVCCVLAGAVIALCGCSGNDGGSGSASGGAVKATDEAATTDVSVPAEPAAVSLETPVLRYLGSYDLGADEDTAAARAAYLSTYAADYLDKSSGKYYFPNGGDTLIISEVVSAGRINEVLTARIQADDSPDLVDVREDSFPYQMSRNMYEDISPYMNMSAPQWAELGEYINAFGIGSKRFYYPWRYEAATERLYYNRTLFEQYGIPDPAEQWSAGEWTWDALLEAVRTFTAAVDGAVGICGDDPAQGFLLSTGTALISRAESGKFVSNIGSPEAASAMEWLDENLRSQGLITSACAGYDSDSAMPAAIGLAAFRAAGSGEFSRYCRDYAEYDMWNVPYPSENGEGAYSADAFGYLVPKGAKNVAGACCFINSCRITEAGERSDAEKSRIMKKNGYTEEEYAYMEQFTHAERFSVVIDYTAFDPGAQAAFAALSAQEGSWQEISAQEAPAFERAAADLSAMVE
mgnify:FL=1